MVMDEPRPPYATEPPSIGLIRWHISEAGRLIDELLVWMKTNAPELSVGMKSLNEFHDSVITPDLGEFELWHDSFDAEYDNC